MRWFVIPLLTAGITTLKMESASSYSLPPLIPKTPTSGRRKAIHRFINTPFAVTLAVFAPPVPSYAVDDNIDNKKETGDTKTETEEERKARLLKEKISASKKNFRKADSYAKERFTTVDYSCVADTGSPCKEAKSVFPSDGKVEDL